MKYPKLLFLFFGIILFKQSHAQDIEQWGRFELTLKSQVQKNAFKDVTEIYPFEIKETKNASVGKEIKVWDFEKFNPAFFRHLEKRIDDLNQLGIETDLILFHPYDKGRWGFDAMPNEVNIRYIKYVMARISSFKNVLVVARK